jgi:signal transduction histidine kinase
VISPRKTLLAVLLFFVCLTLCARGQIVPPAEANVPSENSDEIELESPPAAAVQPTAILQGWSYTSELDPSSLRHGASVVLDPGHPEIILFFGATKPGGHVANDKTEFRYRLDDYDSDWTITRSRLAHYRRLSPGRYRFEVQAREPGEPWQTAEAVLPVQQRPFFYQTWYALVLVGLILIAIAAQLLNQRDQLLKGQMGMVLEERNRIASECHDTLMAGFAAISWQLEATSNLFRDADASTSAAAQSCELARSMVAHCQAEARRIIWDLRNSDQITNILSHALKDAISSHRLRDSVQTTLEILGEEIPISPGAVHHLVCIGQEAVTNALRHASSSNIYVGLRYESELLSLIIRDDGCGFHLSDHAVRTGHFGIPVMEERARKLGGALKLTSSAESGTEVVVTVSFHKVHQPRVQQHYVVPWFGV